MLGEFDFVDIGAAFKRQAHLERVRLGDVVDRFEIAAAQRHREHLARAVGAQRLDRDIIRIEVLACTRKAEARRYAVFEYFERYRARMRRQIVSLFVIVLMPCAVVMDVTVGMTIAVMVAAAAQ
jgi:hypothetical protein